MTPAYHPGTRQEPEELSFFLADTDIADGKLRVFVDFTRLHTHLLPS